MFTCLICGGNRFLGHQVCYHDVIVDGDNLFEDDVEIYESGNPYGPYTCAKCSAEYEELQDRKGPNEARVFRLGSLEDKNGCIFVNAKWYRNFRRSKQPGDVMESCQKNGPGKIDILPNVPGTDSKLQKELDEMPAATKESWKALIEQFAEECFEEL